MKLYLVDISSFIFRAFFAIRRLSNAKGEPTNAVYGVATMLASLIEEAKPDYLGIVYDSKGPSFRKEVYAEYKANRSAPPDDLVPQFDRIEQLIAGFAMHSYRQSGVEADDLIATLTKRWLAHSTRNEVVVVTGDKDLMQLVGERVRVWDTMAKKVYGPDEVTEKFGLPPKQLRDYLALVGDSSDNIPGVEGVGPKSAVDLLKAHGSLEGVLKAAEAGKIAGKKGETIKGSREVAELSARLATLKDDVQIDVEPEDFKYRFHVTPAGLQLLHELDFQKLAQKWENLATDSPPAGPGPGAPGAPSKAPPAAPGPAPAPVQADASLFRTVDDERKLGELLELMRRAGEFGFDLETTSLNPRAAELVGIAIAPATGDRAGYYIPVGHRASLSGGEPKQLPLELVLAKLRPFLEDPRYKKIGQNLKYDWSVLQELGLRPSGIGADTMVAAYVLDPAGRHNLEALADRYLGYKVQTYEEVCGKGKDALTFDQIPVDQATRYSAEDAWAALKLWDALKGPLEAGRLMEIFARVDLPLVEVLTTMERNGVCIDVPFLEKLGAEFSAEMRGIEAQIAQFTKGPVNLNSPKQLAVLLFEELKLPTQGKTKTGYSTDASVLEALAPLHEVPKLLLEYREISKLKGTYVDPLPGLRDAKTGRIHAGFHQAVAATGRLSSSDPNLQNIPIRSARGMKIRRAFVPSAGNLLVSADYSQIELRLLAHMSGDKDLSRSFQVDEDVHRRTASEIFGIAPEAVDDRQRGIAKAINFGLMYGKSAFALAQVLKISRKEAAEVIQKYFARYSGVKNYLDQAVLQAKETGEVRTLLGRRRALPEIQSSNAAVRGSGERMAMNTPIQGTAADLMKLAMIQIDERLRAGKFRAKLTIQVHDEVVLDVPRDEVPAVQKLVVDTMENAMDGIMKLDVPLRVNAAVGETWADL